MYCSPSHAKYVKQGTCYSDNELKSIADEINMKENRNVISKRSKKTREIIQKYFAKQCSDKEYCWLNQLSYATRQKLESAFRPRKPSSWYKNRKTWLNTDDINYVMVQYQHLYKDYQFFGVHPIDFAKRYNGYCIGNNLCDFHITSQLNSNKYRFGLVLNLDKHNEPGSHWVALYCNLNPSKKNFGVYYYDSVASEPGVEVKSFMDKICTQVKQVYHPKVASRFSRKYNTVQRQFKNTECGMFCLVFQTQCMKNIDFDEICQRMKYDDDVNKIRDVLFSPR
jgi:hypothetical protein